MTLLRLAADARGIADAAAVIRGGGIVAIPTDTLYGLAVDPFNARAVARIFDVKGRFAERALPLVAADIEQVIAKLGPLPTVAERLAEIFWPGPLTLLMVSSAPLAPEVSGGTGTVGVRVPAHEGLRALCRACGTPLTATSANISGRPATDDPDDVARTLGGCVDALLDGGKTAGGAPSTIVDATGSTMRLVRPGRVPWDEVLACAHRA